MTVFYVIVYTFVAGVIGTGFGGVVGSLFKKDSTKVMSLLLAFAAGIMLSIVCFDLLPSSVKSMNVYVGLISTSVGVGVVYLLNYFIDKKTSKYNEHLDENHPKTADDLDELTHSDTLITNMQSNSSTKKMLSAGIVMVLAIALHNFPEGLSIGSSYAHVSADGASKATGDILSYIIALHNIPEGMAIVAPLICGGMRKSRAVFLTALSGVSTIFGALICYWIGGASDLSLSICLGLASGAMLYVVFGEIIPQSFLMYKSKLPTFFILIGIFMGILLINLFN